MHHEVDQHEAAIPRLDKPSGHARHPTHEASQGLTPEDFWEDRYSGAPKLWSGHPNEVLTVVAAPLPPGRALDLGCGEGADVIWLAQRGWEATGLDISTTAIERASAAARAAGAPMERIAFRAANLAALDDSDRYDLVTASFLHSPVELPRAEILRRAAALVAAGGHLLLTSHAAAPPWSPPDAHVHQFLSPAEEIDALALAPALWETVIAQTRTRHATAPDGSPATLDDVVVLLRRRV